MRVVLKEEEQLQSFFFFPSVPKEEIEEYDEAESKKNIKPLPPPPLPTDSSRSSKRKKRAKATPYEGEIKREMIKKRKTKTNSGNEDGEEVKEVTRLPARWTAERYRKAETKLMEIVRERGGVRGKPLMRKELRDEARKVIGDTGLLDHLLKHLAGKVVGGGEGDERFMRRHNEDGAMVYWLEPREMVGFEIDAVGERQECGVECRQEIGRLKELVGALRRYTNIKDLF